MEKYINNYSSIDEIQYRLNSDNVALKEKEILEKLLKVLKNSKKYSKKEFLNKQHKLEEKLNKVYIKNIDLKMLQDSLLRAIIEHKVNVRFIIEYYYIMMFNNHGNMSKEILEQLKDENKIVQYILACDSYEEYLQNNNISKDFDKYNELKILNLKQLESALLRSIIERNVNYKFSIEYIYRKLILDDIESQQNLINTINSKFNENNAFFTYILEFNNMEEYIEKQKQLKK